jgi:starvation-inducible DNA-binding protein
MTTPGRDAVVQALSRLLADSYTLQLKTQSFHWNVTGPSFSSLHALFGEQYAELALAVDELAERIRALDAPAPGSGSAFARLTALKEAEGAPPAEAMVRALADDHQAVAGTARALVAAAQAAGDEATADLGIRRIQVHEKAAWMLRSQLA